MGSLRFKNALQSILFSATLVVFLKDMDFKLKLSTNPEASKGNQRELKRFNTSKQVHQSASKSVSQRISLSQLKTCNHRSISVRYPYRNFRQCLKNNPNEGEEDRQSMRDPIYHPGACLVYAKLSKILKRIVSRKPSKRQSLKSRCLRGREGQSDLCHHLRITRPIKTTHWMILRHKWRKNCANRCSKKKLNRLQCHK